MVRSDKLSLTPSLSSRSCIHHEMFQSKLENGNSECCSRARHSNSRLRNSSIDLRISTTNFVLASARSFDMPRATSATSRKSRILLGVAATTALGHSCTLRRLGRERQIDALGAKLTPSGVVSECVRPPRAHAQV